MDSRQISNPALLHVYTNQGHNLEAIASKFKIISLQLASSFSVQVQNVYAQETTVTLYVEGFILCTLNKLQMLITFFGNPCCNPL